MARISHQYRLLKPSGRAFVSIDGNRVYLGKYGSEESKNAYRLALLELQTTGKVSSRSKPTEAAALTINEMLIPFVQHIDGYYVHPDGGGPQHQTGPTHLEGQVWHHDGRAIRAG